MLTDDTPPARLPRPGLSSQRADLHGRPRQPAVRGPRRDARVGRGDAARRPARVYRLTTEPAGRARGARDDLSRSRDRLPLAPEAGRAAAQGAGTVTEPVVDGPGLPQQIGRAHA